jgi:hypothetical protein
VFENRLIGEYMGRQRKRLEDNEDLQNLCSLSYIMKAIKSRWIRMVTYWMCIGK